MREDAGIFLGLRHLSVDCRVLDCYKFDESKYVSVVKMCGMQEEPEFRRL